jgi:uncharacterized membrane protein
MKPTRYFFTGEPLPPDALRDDWRPYPGLRGETRPDRGERAAEVVRDLLGSWAALGAILVLMAAGVTLTDLHDRRADALVVLTLLVSGITLAFVSLVLMATRRLDRLARDRAFHDRESARRSLAVSEEILLQTEQLNAGLARLTARIETLNIRCRAAGDGP